MFQDRDIWPCCIISLLCPEWGQGIWKVLPSAFALTALQLLLSSFGSCVWDWGSCIEVDGYHSLHQGTSESTMVGNPRKHGAGTWPRTPFAKANMFGSSIELSRYFVQYLTNPSLKKPWFTWKNCIPWSISLSSVVFRKVLFLFMCIMCAPLCEYGNSCGGN